MREGLLLQSGRKIDIKRNDGRIHSAVVSCIDWKSGTAKVEWFEGGGTRGKELDIDSIYELNPHLETKRKIEAVGKTDFSTPSTPVPPPDTALNDKKSRLKPSDSRPGAGRKVDEMRRGISPQAKKTGRKSVSFRKEVELKGRKDSIVSKSEFTNPDYHYSTMIKEYRASIEYAPLRENDPVECHQITVSVRKRPLNAQEKGRKELDVVTIPKKDTIIIHEPKSKVDLTKYLENQQFRFDYAFDETCSNETVYKYTVKPLVDVVFNGGVATCFAYGQTGSGKTHTMGGTFSGRTQDYRRGIYALAAKDVFELLVSPTYINSNLVVVSSFFEIYCGKVFDLLDNKALLQVLEDGKQQVMVVGLTERVINSVDDVLSLIKLGSRSRTSGKTSANSNSSRSHAVFQIILRQKKSFALHGKFSLIDLAGNERGVENSSSCRLTRMEGAEINKSLLALKECIRALARHGSHLPFRGSKLTRVLRDSFIGENSRTCMIAMISPGLRSCENSLNTLRYADRLKEFAAGDETANDMTVDGHEADFKRGKIIMPSHSLVDHSIINEEISNGYREFHEVLAHLEQREEELLISFKFWRDGCSKWEEREKSLFNLTDNVADYDPEVFVAELTSVLSERAIAMASLKGKLDVFKKLLLEEDISKNDGP